MKKYISLALIFVMILGLTACKEEPQESISDSRYIKNETATPTFDIITEYWTSKGADQFPDPIYSDETQNFNADEVNIYFNKLGITFPTQLEYSFPFEKHFYRNLSKLTFNYLEDKDSDLPPRSEGEGEMIYRNLPKVDIVVENRGSETVLMRYADVKSLKIPDFTQISLPNLDVFDNVTTLQQVIDAWGTPRVCDTIATMSGSTRDLILMYHFNKGWIVLRFAAFDGTLNSTISEVDLYDTTVVWD